MSFFFSVLSLGFDLVGDHRHVGSIDIEVPEGLRKAPIYRIVVLTILRFFLFFFRSRRIWNSGPVDLESLQLAYPPRTTPEFVLKNGWCPPPTTKPDLPFQVRDTKSWKHQTCIVGLAMALVVDVLFYIC